MTTLILFKYYTSFLYAYHNVRKFYYGLQEQLHINYNYGTSTQFQTSMLLHQQQSHVHSSLTVEEKACVEYSY